MFPGLDLSYADPAQPLTTAGVELLIDDLDLDLSEVALFWSLYRHSLNGYEDLGALGLKMI